MKVLCQKLDPKIWMVAASESYFPCLEPPLETHLRRMTSIPSPTVRELAWKRLAENEIETASMATTRLWNRKARDISYEFNR